MSSNQEAQSDELLALASIYDAEEFRRAESSLKGEIHLCLELSPDFKLQIRGERRVEFDVSFLSLVLSFEFPLDYPSSSAPTFTLSSRWLSRVQKLDEIWEENKGSVVLFTWIQFLKEETLQFLKIQTPLEITVSGQQMPSESTENQSDDRGEPLELDPRAVQDADTQTDFLTSLLDFNEAQKQKVFDASIFCCGICFCENLGSSFTLFKECQHVYCKACIREYFEIQIRDGTVQHLSCPETDCTSMASPAQVKALVSQEVFARYDRLLLQWRLNLMADVVYCPRMSCCAPVLMEPDKTMGICPSCRFVFCTLCYQTYHGFSLCKDLQKEKELNEIQRTHKKIDEEWVKKNSKPCPSCGANIQKDEGCNKMMCISCQELFCWMCLTPIKRENFRAHFTGPNSRCFL
ncbi:hypothetical protein DNTS_022691 [Danionella cerebrum]|uniref:RBR-type E3 ubiquitin transferase n=1 Tax=Danionella cerebrum TaxID=2873325 RepID=A0A553MXZ7_9TELE|nr:hypothetical protein DNTS_022691 [Danionella translucida]TRY58037.1 hypothetical protein DNTS_022691 [Danionella translucida]